MSTLLLTDEGEDGSADQNEEEHDMAWLVRVREEEGEMMKQLAGVTELDDAESIELLVDTTGTSISHIGEMMPNLIELKLNNSTIDSIRDLGTRLSNLQVLWVSRCKLKGLEGIGAMPLLRELYASFNEIDDLMPLEGLDELEIVDLEGNCISEVLAVESLGMCPKLDTLSLAGNPISQSRDYPQMVIGIVSGVEVLDDQTVSSLGNQRSLECKVGEMATDQEITMVSAGLRHARTGLDSNDFLDMEKGGWCHDRPSSGNCEDVVASRIRPSTSSRVSLQCSRDSNPRDQSRPGTSVGRRCSTPGSPLTRPATASRLTSPGLYWRKCQVPDQVSTRPSWSGGSLESSLSIADGAVSFVSDLTHGRVPVMAGSPASALRRRKSGRTRENPDSASFTSSHGRESEVLWTPPHTVNLSHEDDFVEALRQWKISAARMALTPEEGATEFMPTFPGAGGTLASDIFTISASPGTPDDAPAITHSNADSIDGEILSRHSNTAQSFKREDTCQVQLQETSETKKAQRNFDRQIESDVAGKATSKRFSYRRRVMSATTALDRTDGQGWTDCILVDSSMSNDQMRGLQRNAATPRNSNVDRTKQLG